MRWILFRAVAPLLLALAIWLPEHLHFDVEQTAPDPAVLAAAIAQPPDSVLEEVAAMDLAVPLGIPAGQQIAAARDILAGHLALPDFLAVPLPLSGWPQDLAHGSPTLQLALASLGVENLLLDVYESTGEQAFYQAARHRILAFAAWESTQRYPVAFLWNDHAVASRVAVLVRLWRHLRKDAETSDADRAAFLALLDRSGQLLAKDSQFTVRTNHGVMQNIGLLQIGAAFPDLPRVAQWRQTAVERLQLQLGFYVSEEGVVLEHSAEYHVLGTHLLHHAVRLCRLNAISPLPDLLKAAQGGDAFIRQLRRPDGSLPLLGNTAAIPHARNIPETADGKPAVVASGQPLAAPTPGSTLAPLAGYAVWWSGDSEPSQTVVAWAKHDRHGHKHADEPSVHFWSRGYDWLTATGYWPYGARGFAEANGWPGANAPHALGEAAKAERKIHFLGSGEADGLRVLDIENARATGLRIRRQILQLAPESLLVLDIAEGGSDPVETLWTIDPRLTLQRSDEGHFSSDPATADLALRITLATPAGVPSADILRGSWQPFAGWVVVGRQPAPASTLRVQQAGDHSVVGALFDVTREGAAKTLRFAGHTDPEHWRLHLDDAGAAVWRDGDRFTVTDGDKSRTVRIAPPPDLSVGQAALRDAMGTAIRKYPQWRELGAYQRKVYLAIALVWVVSEGLCLLLARGPRRQRWATAIMAAAWAAFAAWTLLWYLR